MALQTYPDLKAAIAEWLKDASLATRAADFIALAEDEFRTDLVMPDMETTVSISGTNPIPLPDDFDSLRAIASSDIAWRTLTQTSLAEFYDLPSYGAGSPAKFAQDGTSLYLWPVPAVPATLTLSYRAKLPSLSDAVPMNWLLTQYPTLYLYASLLHAEFYGWNDERLPLLKAYVEERTSKINAAGTRKKYGGRIAMASPIVENVRGSRYAFKW